MSYFPTVSVTYQVKYFVKFSVNVCEISGQPYRPTICVTNQANCSTVSFHFPTMSVTYQVNYLVKFSEYVCDTSGKLYHCIIPFSDNVCDISGQLPCQRLRRRKKRGGGKKRENDGGKSYTYDVASRQPNGNRLQRRY